MPISPFANRWRIYFVAAHKLILNVSEPPRTAVGLCSSEFFARKTRRWTTYTDVRCSTGYFQKQCSHAVAIFVKAKYYFWRSSTYQNVHGWTGNQQPRRKRRDIKPSARIKQERCFCCAKTRRQQMYTDVHLLTSIIMVFLKKKRLFSISVGFTGNSTNSLNVSYI